MISHAKNKELVNKSVALRNETDLFCNKTWDLTQET